ncbi:hypothetical protein DMC14_002750 [Metamycoplasma phocicerebrale]|uniref:Variable surface lipoprotein n=1 Tax=Metamycoplasma phocicerebrale TaxID=142649 RepID=A0A3T0TUA3_9BACT|nr:hypothetical protein [Metamycoplasma phocicerebrale]AZZ65687.1 hypothetical protein DMC14_002750 [Metamycoplasma phocicerebrale]
MRTNKKILLTVGLVMPTLVSPIIAISCQSEEDKKIQKEFDTKIKEFESLFNINKESISLTKKDIGDYDVLVKNAKKYFKESKSIEEKKSFINILDSAIKEIQKKENDVKSLSDLEKLNRANELLVFSYPNIKNIKLAEADINLIEKKLAKEYEFSLYKAVKNEETQDITIIYKLRNKETKFEHSKNQFFELKGWKKTDAQIQKEQEQLKQLEDDLNVLKVKFLDEKAYQNVLETNKLFNYEQKPNFVVTDYNNDNYKYELSNLIKVNENEYKVNVTLSLKLNKELKKSKEVLIDKNEYGKKGFINPHSLDEAAQISYFEAQLKDVEIYPYYSKDKTFIERKEYHKLTNKSYWLSKKNNQLIYVFKDVEQKDGQNKVMVEVKFENWPESPKLTKELNINLAKLGIDELNEIRKKAGKEPLEDQKAPESTLPDQKEYEKIQLVDFVPTPSDEYIAQSAPHHIRFLAQIKKAKTYLLNKEVQDLIISENSNFLKAQHFVYDEEKYETKSELFIYQFSKTFRDTQNVFILSNPIIEDGKVKSLKLILGSLSDIAAKDYSKLSSTRINLVQNEYGENKLKSYELYKEIELKGFHVNPTYQGEYTKENFDLSKLQYHSVLPEGFELIKPTKAEFNKKKTEWLVPVSYKKNGIISNNFWVHFKIK